MPSLGLKLRLNKITASILKVYTTGLVLWQKMVALPYTGAERMPDSSGTGNVGEIYSGYCFDFATNDSIDVGDTDVNVKTIAFYLYADTTTQDIMELQASGAVMLDVTSGTLTATGFTSPTIYVNGVAGTSIAATTWYHVVITTATAIDANAVKFGVANGVYFNGKLTDIRFYGAELTANQVAEIYANPEKQIPAGLGNSDLVAWWPFTDVAGATAINAVAGGLGGAINGATMENAIPGKVPQWGLKGNSRPMVFDGVNDYISTGTGMAVPTEFTFNWWEQHNQTATTKTLLGWDLTSLGGRLWINITNNNAISVSDAVGISRSTLSNACLPYQLNMVTVHLNITTNTVKIYINAELLVNITFSSTFPFSGTTSVYNIGIFSSSIHRFDGIIFNHGNWDSELSANEIASLYAAGINHDLRTSTDDYISTADLKGYWVNTGNTNADWVDLSGNGNNGTVNGSPVTTLLPEGLVAGKDLVGMDLKYPNNGAFMVPRSGYIIMPNDASLNLGSTWTIATWLYLDNEPASLTYFMHKILSFRLGVTATKAIQVTLWKSSVPTIFDSLANIVKVNDWTYITLTYDNTNLKIYADGILSSTVASTGAIDDGSQMITSQPSFPLSSGKIDSVKLYNVALTADQVLQNYKAEKAAHS